MLEDMHIYKIILVLCKLYYYISELREIIF